MTCYNLPKGHIYFFSNGKTLAHSRLHVHMRYDNELRSLTIVKSGKLLSIIE